MEEKIKVDFQRLYDFLTDTHNDIIPENDDDKDLVDRGFNEIKSYLRTGSRVLDVGCGSGYALDKFKELETHPIGITMSKGDIGEIKSKGYDIRIMDMSFLEFSDESFDFIWARHCLEHSFMPFYTLIEFNRVLKMLGHIYIEVPSPDTSCNNEADPNHYSVLGEQSLLQLITRSGFAIENAYFTELATNKGPDKYMTFICRKEHNGKRRNW